MGSSRKRAESVIQQICCLGLNDQVAIPAVLRELHEFVPSCANVFFWCNDAGEITNLYDERPEGTDLVSVYLNHFYNKRELQVFKGWRRVLRENKRTVDFDELLTVDRRRFLEHEFYHEFLGKLGFQYGLHLVVREGRSHPGALILNRTVGERRFTESEARRVDRLSGFLAHAVLNDQGRDWGWVEGEDEGIMIADGEGRLQWISQKARQLLILATCDRVSRRTQGLDDTLELPPPLKSLCDRLADVREERLASSPPVWITTNNWGRFVFRAHFLEPHAERAGPVGINVSRRQPLPVKLARQLQQLQVSQRQAEVGLWMALGQGYSEIADRLDISEHTAISHSRQLYNRLGVNNRRDLLMLLLKD